MSDLLGCLGSHNGFAVHHIQHCDYLLADLERRLVGVDAERSGDGDILGRHRLGQALPSGEGVTLLLGYLRNDRRAILNLNGLVGLAVYHIVQLVLVDGVAARYRDVVRRHRLRELIPSGEGMAHLLGCIRSDNRLTVDDLYILAELISDLEGGDVGVDGERTCDSHVIGGHSDRQALPAGESVALLGRLGDCRQLSAVLHLGLVVRLSINGISQLVLIDRIAT